MTPILIDSRVMQKLGFFAVLTIVLVFAGGFLVGYQYATTVDEVAAEAESDPQTETGFFASLMSDLHLDEPVEQQTIEKSEAAEESVNNVTVNTVPDSTEDVPVTSNEEPGQAEKTQEKPAMNDASTSVDNREPEQAATEGPDEILFSIQVGTFNELKYAQKMKRKLQEQNMDAYVTSFNRNNKTRFNVRLGYFTDRKSANASLADYKNNQKGDGYVVNFSDKNIIHSDEDDYELAIYESARVKESAESSRQRTPMVDTSAAQDNLSATQDTNP